MPLPQQVINQLSREPAETSGWSAGVVFFSGALLVVVLIIYFAMTLGYEPYLNSQISSVENKINTLSQSISSQDQTNLLSFYSQISNLQTLLSQHVFFSQFLSWLDSNTEANVSYTSFSFSSGNEISLTATASSEADINEQIAIFQGSPEVENVAISNVGAATGSGGGFQFSATLLMNPSVFTSPTSAAASTTTQ
jgi:Tfp pilus assembly protein PilN